MIKTWDERCAEHPDHQTGMVTERMIVRRMQEEIAELRAALAQSEPVCDKDPQGCWSVRCQLGKVCKNAPPQRKPLTEEQIEYLAPVSFTWRDMVTFARMIEHEHGIGGEHE